MRPFVRPIIAILLAVVAAGCGKEIGDSCTLDTDCSPNGDRLCLDSSCTIAGCDHDTCPDEAICVRFFAVESTGLPCNPETEDLSSNDCSPDELCTLSGNCVVSASEVRYCMRACEDGGDCNDDQECRTRELMLAHGGEPVLPPGQRPTSEPQPFCARANN